MGTGAIADEEKEDKRANQEMIIYKSDCTCGHRFGKDLHEPTHCSRHGVMCGWHQRCNMHVYGDKEQAGGVAQKHNGV